MQPMTASRAMPDTDAFHDLALAIADLYAAEGRPGGDATARALRDAAADLPELAPTPPPPHLDQLKEALGLSPHTLAKAIADALPVIVWQHAGLADGRIVAEVAVQMLTAEIIGPTGMIFNATLRAGLFLQTRGVAYTTRSHAAEETYFPLTGTARWSLNGTTPKPRPFGQFIFHPSMAPHATFTDADPLLALWRWSGDIGWDSYEMAG